MGKLAVNGREDYNYILSNILCRYNEFKITRECISMQVVALWSCNKYKNYKLFKVQRNKLKHKD